VAGPRGRSFHLVPVQKKSRASAPLITPGAVGSGFAAGRNLDTMSLEAESKQLAQIDSKFASLVATYGYCDLSPGPDGFTALCRSLIGQQLAKSAAVSIYRRFCELFPDGTPEPQLAADLSFNALSVVGVSKRKSSYIHALAASITDGSLPLRQMGNLEDDDVIGHLIGVNGIGRWTAQMYLIFTLARLDVFPEGDTAVALAMKSLYGETHAGTEESRVRVANSWKPVRSVATWYLYKYRDGT